MKTTLELPDDLFERSKAMARREGITLRALVEEGLRLALRSRLPRRRGVVRLEPFEGDGLSAEFAGTPWAQIRDAIYAEMPAAPPAARQPARETPRRRALAAGATGRDAGSASKRGPTR